MNIAIKGSQVNFTSRNMSILAWGIDQKVKILTSVAFAALLPDEIIGVVHRKRPFYYQESPTPSRNQEAVVNTNY